MKIIRKILRLFGYKPKQKDLKIFIRVKNNDTGEWTELICDETKLDINPPNEADTNPRRNGQPNN
jgi:hypothetical protein